MSTARRIGKNEALFREVNERIRELNEAFESSSAELADFVCECSLESCRDYVQLALGEYEHVRAVSTRFFVAPGHIWTPEVEHAVEQHDRYWILEKVGTAGEVAAERDPRDR